jgi:apolipoprotein N-acyltransferase
VWPEVALPFYLHNVTDTSELKSILLDMPYALIGSRLQSNDPENDFNGILRWERADTSFKTVHRKQQLAPIIETGFLPAPEPMPPTEIMGSKIGFSICWENTFSGLMRTAVRDGAEVLVAVTSDLFAHHTDTPALHTRISAFRAVENARPVIHASISGPSAIFDSHGQVVAQSKLGETTVITATVTGSRTTTLFTRFGDWLGTASPGFFGR